ncbi:MAG: hypothetical protein IT384_29585 [Deltaproteobacteria bacterium]|nr:hypothetical protein [Deltaproteobacteria bacterium]
MRVLVCAALISSAALPGAPSRSPPVVQVEPARGVSRARVEQVEEACRAIGALLGAGRRLDLGLAQASSVDDFAQETRRARFEAAAMVGRVLWLQPSSVLERLPDVEAILRHECVHAWLRALDVPPLPATLEEALACGLAGQVARLPPGAPLSRAELVPSDGALRAPRDPGAAQHALSRAASTFWPRLRALHQSGELVDTLRRAARGPVWTDALWDAMTAAPDPR